MIIMPVLISSLQMSISVNINSVGLPMCILVWFEMQLQALLMMDQLAVLSAFSCGGCRLRLVQIPHTTRSALSLMIPESLARGVSVGPCNVPSCEPESYPAHKLQTSLQVTGAAC